MSAHADHLLKGGHIVVYTSGGAEEMGGLLTTSAVELPNRQAHLSWSKQAETGRCIGEFDLRTAVVRSAAERLTRKVARPVVVSSGIGGQLGFFCMSTCGRTHKVSPLHSNVYPCGSARAAFFVA